MRYRFHLGTLGQSCLLALGSSAIFFPGTASLAQTYYPSLQSLPGISLNCLNYMITEQGQTICIGYSQSLPEGSPPAPVAPIDLAPPPSEEMSSPVEPEAEVPLPETSAPEPSEEVSEPPAPTPPPERVNLLD